jgi:hypothetical protein
MNPQEPVIPEPDSPRESPGAPVGDPSNPDLPTEYNAAADEDLDEYDKELADSFPASDPPAASEPGVP